MSRADDDRGRFGWHGGFLQGMMDEPAAHPLSYAIMPHVCVEDKSTHHGDYPVASLYVLLSKTLGSSHVAFIYL